MRATPSAPPVTTTGALTASAPLPRRRIAALSLIAGVVAATILLPALGIPGIADGAEMAALQRARAALGVSLSDLVRSPWLPDALRTAAYAAVGAPEAIRLPGAVAAIGLVSLTTLIAAARGLGPLAALIAGGFALAFPLTLAQGRLALGDPIGELFAASAAILGTFGLRLTGWRAAAAAIATAAAIALATASSGLLAGALIPLLAIAVGRPTAPKGWVRLAVTGVWLASAAVAITAAILIVGQGDGYIPLLGTAKDLGLRERPHLRGFTSSLQDLGFQVFPWLPLALIGILRPGRLRWPALWFLCGLGVHTLGSLTAGPGPLPLTIPTALCATAGLIHLGDPTTHRQLRRFALLLAIGGVLVLHRDAHRAPMEVLSVLDPPTPADRLPVAAIAGDRHLAHLRGLALLMIIAAGVAGGRRIAKPWLAPGVAALILLYQATITGHRLIPTIADKRALKGTLGRYAAWVDAGELPATLAVHRIRDSGLEIYGPAAAARTPLLSRRDLIAWLRRPEPSVALAPRGELAALVADHRRDGWPLFVLDANHSETLLLGNHLPAGARDHNPLLGIVHDAAPRLAHETLVRFDDYLEVVGWELPEPILRGDHATATLILRVLRPLPSSAQIYVRLQRGKLSRISAAPQAFADGLYPPSLWRPGDYILHHHRIEVPLLEVVSGTHELLVGIQRAPKKNLEIREPSDERGAYGVTIRGNKREFAALGEIRVW